MQRHDFRLVPDPSARPNFGRTEYLCSCGQWFSLKDGSDTAYVEGLSQHRRDEAVKEGGQP